MGQVKVLPEPSPVETASRQWHQRSICIQCPHRSSNFLARRIFAKDCFCRWFSNFSSFSYFALQNELTSLVTTQWPRSPREADKCQKSTLFHGSQKLFTTAVHLEFSKQNLPSKVTTMLVLCQEELWRLEEVAVFWKWTKICFHGDTRYINNTCSLRFIF